MINDAKRAHKHTETDEEGEKNSIKDRQFVKRLIFCVTTNSKSQNLLYWDDLEISFILIFKSLCVCECMSVNRDSECFCKQETANNRAKMIATWLWHMVKNRLKAFIFV